jgi:hypothetical protein
VGGVQAGADDYLVILLAFVLLVAVCGEDDKFVIFCIEPIGFWDV